MRVTQLGKTPTRISSAALGTMYFGTAVDENTSHRLLDQFSEEGGTFIDTANTYSYWRGGSGGESETVIGKWLAVKKNRSRMFVSTKVGMSYPGVADGLKAEAIIRECEKSLQRLQRDTIDLYVAHADDTSTPLEETLAAFDSLVKSGKVRYIGASNHKSARLAAALDVSRENGWIEYCSLQQKYTYLRPNPSADFGPLEALDEDLLNRCANEQITVFGYGPLLNGAYSRADREVPVQYRNKGTGGRLKLLRDVAAEAGITINQAVLAWILSRGVVPIIGAGTPEQLAENLGALGVNLTDKQIDLLDLK
jgi:aryl-alcohol dehydrogenase-like predicted oxidoreductase